MAGRLTGCDLGGDQAGARLGPDVVAQRPLGCIPYSNSDLEPDGGPHAFVDPAFPFCVNFGVKTPKPAWSCSCGERGSADHADAAQA